MAKSHVVSSPGMALDEPVVRRIGPADLKAALKEGIDDFRAMPTHAFFIALIYPVLGLFLARLTFGYDVLPLLFPLMSGFALIGPFAAIGLTNSAAAASRAKTSRGRGRARCCAPPPSAPSWRSASCSWWCSCSGS